MVEMCGRQADHFRALAAGCGDALRRARFRRSATAYETLMRNGVSAGAIFASMCQLMVAAEG